jgi:hypothetical protein
MAGITDVVEKKTSQAAAPKAAPKAAGARKAPAKAGPKPAAAKVVKTPKAEAPPKPRTAARPKSRPGSVEAATVETPPHRKAAETLAPDPVPPAREPITIWAISDGRAGIEAQALGLAEAVARQVPATIEVKHVVWNGRARPPALVGQLAAAPLADPRERHRSALAGPVGRRRPRHPAPVDPRQALVGRQDLCRADPGPARAEPTCSTWSSRPSTTA